MAAVLTQETLAASPLKFSYPITPTVSIDTTVTGDGRQYATVAVIYGSLTLWSGTMIQTAPEIKIPYPLIAGSITIEEDGLFILTVPTSMQTGSVVANLMIKNPNSEVPFEATVASWPLSSST